MIYLRIMDDNEQKNTLRCGLADEEEARYWINRVGELDGFADITAYPPPMLTPARLAGLTMCCAEVQVEGQK